MRTLFLALVVSTSSLAATPAGKAGPDAGVAAAQLPEDPVTLQPAEVVKLLAEKGEKPLLFHVGFKKLYQGAHIPGSEYLGPGNDPDAMEKLRVRVAKLPKTASILIYCGCCPWERCPNIKAAWKVLRAQGFTNVKSMFVAKDFGADWADKGYPVAKGD